MLVLPAEAVIFRTSSWRFACPLPPNHMRSAYHYRHFEPAFNLKAAREVHSDTTMKRSTMLSGSNGEDDEVAALAELSIPRQSPKLRHC
jgi:hypothetical protein